MENKFSHLKKLIDWAEKFEEQLPDGQAWDDKNFANWLSKEVNTTDTLDTSLKAKPKPAIAMFILFMYKYASFYSRKILKNAAIYSLDDFSFLASLLPNKQLRKSDVIRKNITEKSSGNEVLKRLLRQKLIKETDNPNDKRSKLLELTPDGFNQINAVRSQFEKMGLLVAGNLSEDEQTTLLDMLAKLHEFHKPLFDANDEKILNEKLGIEK